MLETVVDETNLDITPGGLKSRTSCPEAMWAARFLQSYFKGFKGSNELAGRYWTPYEYSIGES